MNIGDRNCVTFEKNQQMLELTIDTFSEEKRKEFLEDAFAGVEAILHDALEGEDNNGIRSSFPADVTLDKIGVDQYRVSMVYENDAQEAFIEASVQFGYGDIVLGEYRSVYNLRGDLQDEFLTLE